MILSIFFLRLLVYLLLDLLFNYYLLSLFHDLMLWRLYQRLRSLSKRLWSRCQLLFLLFLNDLLILLVSVLGRLSGLLLALPRLALEVVLGISLAGERVLGVAPVISHDDETAAVNHDGLHPGVVGAPSLEKGLLRGAIALEQRRGLKFI